MHAGSDELFVKCDETQRRFKFMLRKMDSFKFVGIEIATIPEGIRLHQEALLG